MFPALTCVLLDRFWMPSVPQSCNWVTFGLQRFVADVAPTALMGSPSVFFTDFSLPKGEQWWANSNAVASLVCAGGPFALVDLFSNFDLSRRSLTLKSPYVLYEEKDRPFFLILHPPNASRFHLPLGDTHLKAYAPLTFFFTQRPAFSGPSRLYHHTF